MFLKRRDHEKGLERIGRGLANQFAVGWKEYWPFLDSFVDLASEEGLQLLEKFLKARYTTLHGSYYSNSSQSTDPISMDVQFNNVIQELSPISDLCKALQACTIKDGSLNRSNKSSGSFELVSDQLLNIDALFKSDFSPFLCVEKACQVFAQRFLKNIQCFVGNNCDNISTLETQVKQLQLLISSYMDDCRFISVDFHLIHSRLGSLIKCKIKDTLQKTEIEQLSACIQGWLETYSKNFDCFSSDDESVNNPQVVTQKRSTSKNKQVICVLECVLSNLNNLDDVVCDTCKTEDECISEWGNAKTCSCVFQNKYSKKNNKRVNSLKYTLKNVSCLLKNGTDVAKRLFHEDSGKCEKNCRDIMIYIYFTLLANNTLINFFIYFAFLCYIL